MIVMDSKGAWRVSLIDKLLEGEINKSSLSSECAVLLSGGVDSISVAFAAQRLGMTIPLFLLSLDTHIEMDIRIQNEFSFYNPTLLVYENLELNYLLVFLHL